MRGEWSIEPYIVGWTVFTLFILVLCLFLLVLPTYVQAGQGELAPFDRAANRLAQDRLRPGSEQVLTRAKVQAALRYHVLERSSWQPEQVEVRVRPFTPLTLPAGRVNLRIIRPRKGVTPGPRSFFLAVEVGGEEKKRMWVRADIRVFDQVVVTSRPLAHYEVITPTDVRLERRELSSPTRAFTKIAEVVGQQASHAIEINKTLTLSMVELPRVMRRGSAVTLVYETSGLKAETRGRAVKGGRVGDVIPVKNSSSGKIIEGQILDEHRVQVNW